MTAGPGRRGERGARQRRASPRAVIRAAAGTGAACRLPGERTGHRWGLVLGGGGVLGAAWLVGALEALERSRGVDARTADVILGTSAGAIVGSLIGAGVPVADLKAQQLGERRADGPAERADFDGDDPVGGAMPPRPRLVPGNARSVARNARRWREMPASAVLAGLRPTGRGSMPAVSRLIEAAVPAGEWAPHPGVRVVTLDYDTGDRTVFGAPGSPAAGLSEAVLASCAIPGWFQPVEIGGRRYVDGGVWSANNTDLLADDDLDEVIVLAPMVSWQYDTPRDWRVRLERSWRTRITRRALGEARTLNRRGTTVTVLGPGPDDLELIGFNLMAPAGRRQVLETSVRTSLAALEAIGGSRVVDLDAAGGLDLTAGEPGARVEGTAGPGVEPGRTGTA